MGDAGWRSDLLGADGVPRSLKQLSDKESSFRVPGT